MYRLYTTRYYGKYNYLFTLPHFDGVGYTEFDKIIWQQMQFIKAIYFQIITFLDDKMLTFDIPRNTDFRQIVFFAIHC